MNLFVDENSFREFHEIVPKLEDDEVLICILAARKKYAPIAKSEEMLDKLILKTNDVDRAIGKLRKFGFVDRVYLEFNTMNWLPKEAMAMYIDLHPKSTIKAFSLFQQDIMKWIFDKINNPDFNSKTFRKLDTKLFSALARATSRRPYYLVDVDVKDEKVLRYVLDLSKGQSVFIQPNNILNIIP